MGKKKKSVLPKIEVLIILVFFASFILWAATKCNSTKLLYQEEEITSSLELNDKPTETNEDSIESLANQEKSLLNQINPTDTPIKFTSSSTSNRQRYSRLYVTIEGLKLREEPNLNSPVLATFTLFEEVSFLEEVTEFTTKINLGNVEVTEPWIKVKAKKGHTGWVYGAGVNYYKKKTEGAF